MQYYQQHSKFAKLIPVSAHVQTPESTTASPPPPSLPHECSLSRLLFWQLFCQ